MSRKIVSTITVLLTAVFLPIVMYVRAESQSTNNQDSASGSSLSNIEISVDQVVASGFVNPVQVTHAGDGAPFCGRTERPDPHHSKWHDPTGPTPGYQRKGRLLR